MAAIIAAPAKPRSVDAPRFEHVVDYRERRARDVVKFAERRLMDIAEQYSALNSSTMRIRAWEHLHGLRMPSAPAHPVLWVIAAATQLSMTEVRDEQLRRCERGSV